jgi:hypothetical protein
VIALDSSGVDDSALTAASLEALAQEFLENLARVAESRSRAA